MSKKQVYFCGGCSAVFENKIEYCPHCGRKQYYNYVCENCSFETDDETIKECPECNFDVIYEEYEYRSCPNCGYNHDTDGRNLSLKYCYGSDCGMEIGGLIRYSDKTGKPLTVDQIFTVNDYTKELKDWLKCLYSEGTDDTFHRLLYIYDKNGKYTGQNFIDTYLPILEDYPAHYISDFSKLTDDINIDILTTISKREQTSQDLHCICTIDINAYKERTVAHDVIKEYVYDYIPGYETDFFDIFRKISATFIFISSHLPEETKLYDMFDRHILIVSPEILKSVDIKKIWKEIKEEAKR